MNLQPVDFKAVAAKGAYVYCYLRKDGSPYYVGIASNAARPLERHNCGVPRKHPERVRIMRSGLSWEEACQWECFYIARYGRKDIGTGILHNRTDGGDGTPGLVRSEEDKAKKSAAARRRYEDPAQRTLTSLSQAGKHEYRKQPEYLARLSAALKGRSAWNKNVPMESAERRHAAGNGSRGRVQTPEEKLRRSESNKGKTRTPEQRERYRLAAIKREAAKKARLLAAA